MLSAAAATQQLREIFSNLCWPLFFPHLLQTKISTLTIFWASSRTRATYSHCSNQFSVIQTCHSTAPAMASRWIKVRVLGNEWDFCELNTLWIGWVAEKKTDEYFPFSLNFVFFYDSEQFILFLQPSFITLINDCYYYFTMIIYLLWHFFEKLFPLISLLLCKTHKKHITEENFK